MNYHNKGILRNQLGRRFQLLRAEQRVMLGKLVRFRVRMTVTNSVRRNVVS